ncbi:peptidase C15 [Methylobacterium sp. Leaf104]|uniref:pyroglutamyl-peptidase I family protein n=1 Tax=Methylobacterium TaxID=407 RepID=UPI0006F24BF7|nr:MULTISPECIES: peptidase C15 [Methylobacterium]KQP38225.1 peptidase C15 [Methylobacterium sp. Leaf104]MCI9880396.1 peptidase C15 [Methylobacterium goesingense]
MAGPLLITGFGPFPGVPRNPSAALARRIGALARPKLGGVPVRVLILSTTYAAIPDMLEPALAGAPAAILMLGVATRARRARVELQGRNRTSRLFPDASGRIASRLTLETEGPPARRSSAAGPALAALRGHGIAAIPSRDAGRYLCNATYFRALRDGPPALFVHIPLPPRTRRPAKAPVRPRRQAPEEALARGCAEVARRLVLRGRAGR